MASEGLVPVSSSHLVRPRQDKQPGKHTLNLESPNNLTVMVLACEESEIIGESQDYIWQGEHGNSTHSNFSEWFGILRDPL